MADLLEHWTTISEDNPYIEKMAGNELAWLGSYLNESEFPIAWLSTSTKAACRTSSRWDFMSGANEWKFLMTDKRAGLIAFPSKPDETVACQELPRAEMKVTNVIGRDECEVGNIGWRTQLTNDGLFREIAQLQPLDPFGRLFGLARLAFMRGGKKGKHAQYARNLMEDLSKKTPDPFLLLALVYVQLAAASPSNKEDLFKDASKHAELLQLGRGLVYDGKPEDLIRWTGEWRLSKEESLSLAKALLHAMHFSADIAAYVCPLLEVVRGENVNQSNRALASEADILYARCLILCKRHSDAQSILEQRLSTLPDESLEDLLPNDDIDLAKGEGGQKLKIQTLKLLVEARGAPDQDDVAALSSLASLQPLVPQVLKRFGEACDSVRRKRVNSVLQLLQSVPGCSDEDPDWQANKDLATPLTAAQIDGLLRDPRARAGTKIAALRHGMMGLIASTSQPDFNQLRAHAVRVTPETHPAICDAVAVGALLLGLNSPDIRISSGDASHGVCAYEGNPPFILIGDDHLRPASSYFLSPPEMRFLLGVQLAHLRFGHKKITSSGLWQGVIEKLYGGAFLCLDLIPFAGTTLSRTGKNSKQLTKLAQKATKSGHENLARILRSLRSTANVVGKSAKHLPQEAASTLKSKGGNLREKLKRGAEDPSPSLVEDDRKLIGSAYTLMQLTADRAGLLLAGDIVAAVRAIFRSSVHYAPELGMAEKYGLSKVLSRSGQDGKLLNQSLAVRLAALFAFYISDEYQSLRNAAFPLCQCR